MKEYFEILSELENLGFDMEMYQNIKKNYDDSIKRYDVTDELKAKWQKESKEYEKEINLCNDKIKEQLKQIENLLKTK